MIEILNYYISHTNIEFFLVVKPKLIYTDKNMQILHKLIIENIVLLKI